MNKQDSLKTFNGYVSLSYSLMNYGSVMNTISVVGF